MRNDFRNERAVSSEFVVVLMTCQACHGSFGDVMTRLTGWQASAARESSQSAFLDLRSERSLMMSAWASPQQQKILGHEELPRQRVHSCLRRLPVLRQRRGDRGVRSIRTRFGRGGCKGGSCRGRSAGRTVGAGQRRGRCRRGICRCKRPLEDRCQDPERLLSTQSNKEALRLGPGSGSSI